MIRKSVDTRLWPGVFVILLAGCGGGGAESTESVGDKPAEPAAVAAPSGTASISGTITYEGAIPTLKPIDMTAEPTCAAKHGSDIMPQVLVLGEGQTMANVFVRVKSGLPAGNWTPPSEPAVIDQVGCRYTPHVLGVMVGQTVKVLNSDGILHNVHALPKTNQEFNMAMPATRTEAERSFDKVEEPFRVKCDVHPWMGAWISVLDHPFFDVTAEDGSYEIAGLPAGSYSIEAWHERLGTRTADVTVTDGGTAAADFVFSR